LRYLLDDRVAGGAGMSDQDGSLLGCIGFVVLVAGAIWWAGGINSAWYSARYAVLPSKVQIDPEPKDCDFMHAPLGSKGCHYDANVAAYNANGDLVGGDNAPRYSRDTKTGKPIVSYNDGATWEWLLGATEVPIERSPRSLCHGPR